MGDELGLFFFSFLVLGGFSFPIPAFFWGTRLSTPPLFFFFFFFLVRFFDEYRIGLWRYG